MRRNRTHVMEFEVERGSGSVAYEVHFEVSPAEPEIRWGDNANPGCPAAVESKTVYFVRRDRKTGKDVREERPELEDLVDDEELLEHAGDQDDGGPDTLEEARCER